MNQVLKKTMNNYVLYQHLKPCGEIFYIGYGDIKRPYKKSGRSHYWKNTVSKYGYIIEILYTDLTLEEAQHLEIWLIFYHGRKDQRRGNLINLTNGGEGRNGYIMSDEQKQKCSESALARNITGYWLNKTLSDEHRNKISTSRILKKSCIGTKRSDITRLKQSLNNGRSKKVINLNTKEIYISVKECSMKNNIKHSTLKSILNGRMKNTTEFIHLDKYNTLNEDSINNNFEEL